MSAKSIRFRELARYKMFAGADMLSDAVKVALGAEGRSVVLEHIAAGQTPSPGCVADLRPPARSAAERT